MLSQGVTCIRHCPSPIQVMQASKGKKHQVWREEDESHCDSTVGSPYQLHQMLWRNVPQVQGDDNDRDELKLRDRHVWHLEQTNIQKTLEGLKDPERSIARKALNQKRKKERKKRS